LLIVDCKKHSSIFNQQSSIINPLTEKKMPTFTAAALKKITEEIFLAAGVPKKESRSFASSGQANTLIEANLAGVDSHGVMRIPQYVESIQTGKIIPSASLDVIIVGHKGFGFNN
jgi:LDH2 family malate/lactate/ureidoglycolate dehydrogenase